MLSQGAAVPIAAVRRSGSPAGRVRTERDEARLEALNVLDILLLVAAVWFAIVGYRQGFVVGILSVIGFLGGGLVAVYLLPFLWDRATGDHKVSTTVAVVAVVVVIVCASIGQALTTHLGNKLRRFITWSRPVPWTRPEAPSSTWWRCSWSPG